MHRGMKGKTILLYPLFMYEFISGPHKCTSAGLYCGGCVFAFRHNSLLGTSLAHNAR